MKEFMESVDVDTKRNSQAYEETSLHKVMMQRKNLDNVLVSVKGFTDESKLTRQYLVGQIEALDYVIKLYSV